MSDERPRTTDDPIDAAIDRAVRDLMAHEAPADLGARVLARIERPPVPPAWWSPAVLAWAGAALAVVVMATYLAWPSRPAPVTDAESVVTEARSPAKAPITRTVPAKAGATKRAAPAKAPERAVAAASVVEPEPYEFATPRLVEPLEAPAVVSIEPLAEPQVTIEPLTVTR